MRNAHFIERTEQPPSRPGATVVVVYYLITFLAGAFILSFHGRWAFAADSLLALFYLAATTLLYDLSKPQSKGSASPAAWFKLVGLVAGKLHLSPRRRMADRVARGDELAPSMTRGKGQHGVAIVVRTASSLQITR